MYNFGEKKHMKIAIASDHAGYEIKKGLIEYLKNQGHEVKDMGTGSTKIVDYPDYGHLLALAVERRECEKGISICGSGNGINMTVNKHQGIRSALCWTEEIAALARRHNDANICAIPGRFVNTEEAILIVRTFLENKFEGGRHEKRIKKIPLG